MRWAKNTLQVVLLCCNVSIPATISIFLMSTGHHLMSDRVGFLYFSLIFVTSSFILDTKIRPIQYLFAYFFSFCPLFDFHAVYSYCNADCRAMHNDWTIGIVVYFFGV